ncbi:Transient-receptor-potential-like protein [Taenia solium]|eukprot:TsM_000955000 transcript=TsM_000955000 gene=TsM_000955000
MATINLSGRGSSNLDSNEGSSTSDTGGGNTLMHPPVKRANEAESRRRSPSFPINLGTSKVSRNNSYRYQQTETMPSRFSGKLSLQPKEMPDFGEGTDQKVLPLPPVRSNPTDWFSHSPDRSCSSATNNDNSNVNGHPPYTSTYRFGRFSSNFVKESGQADPLSRIFLDAVERGDKSTVARCLRCSHPVNVNCTNMLGRTAIQIAVDNENFEIVELLLKEPNIRIGDALLYAVQEGVYRIVEMLIDHHSITKEMLGTSWSKRNSLSEESHDFSADISPVILASICNQFEILQLLLSRGAGIERPHRSNCSCRDCATMYKEDSLKYSLWRINTYRALASPAWISLTSPDPILAAFKLSWELNNLASRENEFKEVFLQLSDQCKKYACDLLDQCRSKEEVLAVLSRSSDDEDVSMCDDEGNEEGESGKEHVKKSALRRTTTVIHRPSRRWQGKPLHMDNFFELGDLDATRLGSNKRLESQHTIVEDLANLESHEERMYFEKENGVKRKAEVVGDALETDLDEIYDGGDEMENENDLNESEVEIETPPLRLDRLKLAIKYEQKRVREYDS